MSAKRERGEEEEREGLGPPEIKLRAKGSDGRDAIPATAVVVLRKGERVF